MRHVAHDTMQISPADVKNENFQNWPPKNALYWPCQRHIIPNLLVYITSIYNKKKVCKRSKSWVCYMGVVRWDFQIQVKYKNLTHILVVKMKIFCDLPLVTWPCILCREWKQMKVWMKLDTLWFLTESNMVIAARPAFIPWHSCLFQFGAQVS